MREQLLGYLLGALDADEQAAIERQLAVDPQLRRELESLRSQLLPLETGRMEYEPPGDLVARTCAQLDSLPQPAEVGKIAPAATGRDSYAHRSSFTMLEMLLTAGVCAAMAILFFPAVLESRDQSRRIFCQQSLRQLGEALTRYSLEHDTIPAIPANGRMSFAGFIPVELQEAGYLTDPTILICPGSDLAAETEKFTIPSFEELQSAMCEATGHRFWNMKCRAAGSLGFNLGIFENGTYYAPVNEGRWFFVWASDAPSFHLPNRISANHSGRGMNLLFEDGHIEFVEGCCVPHTRDDVLRSIYGLAEAGRDKDDSVIGASIGRPTPASLFRGE